jgi:hypothetical protein
MSPGNLRDYFSNAPNKYRDNEKQYWLWKQHVIFVPKSSSARAALRKQNGESYAESTVCYRKTEGPCANVALLAEQMSLDTAIVAAP